MGSLKGFLDLTTDISSTGFVFSVVLKQVCLYSKTVNVFYFFRIKAHGVSFFIFGNTSKGPLG